MACFLQLEPELELWSLLASCSPADVLLILSGAGCCDCCVHQSERRGGMFLVLKLGNVQQLMVVQPKAPKLSLYRTADRPSLPPENPYSPDQMFNIS